MNDIGFTETEILLCQKMNPETGKMEYQWRSADGEAHSPVYDDADKASHHFDGTPKVRQFKIKP